MKFEALVVIIRSQKGRGGTAKLVILILVVKRSLPFRENCLSYSLLMILSLRCMESVCVIGMPLNTPKQCITKAAHIACGRE